MDFFNLIDLSPDFIHYLKVFCDYFFHIPEVLVEFSHVSEIFPIFDFSQAKAKKI